MREALARPVLEAAPALLGAVLVRGPRRARLVEVEAYAGPRDPGSHAYRGKTPRTLPMWGQPGTAYVYFTYGMHWCMNVVVQPEGEVGAVLVRAAEPLTGLDEMRAARERVGGPVLRPEALLSGPARLAQAFGIDGTLSGADLLAPDAVVRLEAGSPPHEVVVTTRIGLAPGKGEEFPWRFVDAGATRWLSRPVRSRPT